MSSYSEGQTHLLMEALETAGFTPADITKLGQFGSSRLNEIRFVLNGKAKIVSIPQDSWSKPKPTIPSVIPIDRSTPFNPTTFIGSGVTIWRGPADSAGLEGDEEQDLRSLVLTELPLSSLLFEHMLKERETVVTGEERLKRLVVARRIRLDAKIAQVLFEEQGQVTLRWLYDNHKITWIEFTGTTLRSSDGDRCFLYLYRNSGGWWCWGYSWLDDGRRACDLAVSLASSTQD